MSQKQGTVTISAEELARLKAAANEGIRVTRRAQRAIVNGQKVDDPEGGTVVEVKIGNMRGIAHTDRVWAQLLRDEAVKAVRAELKA